ncbi:FtsK/SpoIIIE domain-containing protein [Naasia sp. SYSU D00057]|uniref:FtsK/SpoIIIE domain-containing protein n=1 Tax=Naasia sp. SYSU D00057 TaxID=2817380 RepID=UPI001B301856|nr:FtsK/SpoIIIE domain-containing protein [Naasia sp. SYSU D00057]
MHLPPPLPDPEPVPFPLAATVAPVLAGAVLFAITRSPLSLALAGLAPVLALAALLDARRQRRRARRRARARRAVALDRLRVEVAAEHARRIAALRAAAPFAADVVAGHSRPGSRVVLGAGGVPSGIALAPQEPEDEDLVREAAVLPAAPVTAERGDLVGLAGPPVLTAAVARSLAVQGCVATRARRVEELAASCPVVVLLSGVRLGEVMRHPDAASLGRLRPELVSAASAGRRDERPAAVTLVDLGPPGAAAGLAARFAVTSDGPLELDLVRDGTHAIVGGTTGSGKSELLVSWVLALAAAHPPERLAVLLVDFKGGTAFDPLAGLPHVAGLVTDLDPDSLARLATGLRAELLRRERVLRDHAARSVEAVPALGRLVVVIDEFAALLAAEPALSDVVTDLAARGRALGVHLVLGTQRPTGVMREALLANCGLRIALRMLAAEDSRALLGDPGAALLPAGEPGACLVSRSGEPPVRARIASSSAAPAAHRGRAVAPVWLPPLPPLVGLAELSPRGADALVVGVLDLPAEQRRDVAEWRPGVEGALLGVGGRRSGRSTLLATLAEQSGAPVIAGGAPAGGETLWDAVAAAGPELILVDDLDLALADLSDEHAAELGERLARLVRGGRASLAATAHVPLAPAIRPLAAAAGRVLALGDARDELAGIGRRGAASLPPGAGWWRGERVQVAVGSRPPRLAASSVQAVPVASPAIVVTRTPARRQDAAGEGVVAVTPEEWQSSPALWPSVATTPMLLIGCSAAEHRAVTRRRELPPALAPIDGRAWLVAPGHPTSRVSVLPSDASSAPPS